ncbi:MAG: GAF domain-containing protein, partial [Smithellaceae bacterium]|nr:GAF domain-containing protein [Smithellaceae bacterium]
MSERKTSNDNSPKVTFLDKDKLLQSIFRISASLTAPSKLEDILAKILDEVVDTIGFDRGIIRLFDHTKQNLETKVVKNYPPEGAAKVFSTPLNMDLHDCISTRVAKTGEPIAIEDATTDQRITDTDRMLTNIYNRGSIFCAPLKTGDDVIGIIAAWCEEETKFFPEEINLFLTFANQISIIIQNAMLFENNAEKIRQLMLLQEAVSEMNFNYVLDDRILDILIQSAQKVSGAEKVLVYFLDIERNRCFIKDESDILIEGETECEKRIKSSIIERAIKTNGIIVRKPPYDNSLTS